jgi:hypothetical protein
LTRVDDQRDEEIPKEVIEDKAYGEKFKERIAIMSMMISL